MERKKKEEPKFARQLDLEAIKRKVRQHRRSVAGKWLTVIILAAMALGGTYLLVLNKGYTKVELAGSYEKNTSDTNNYAAFAGGIVRYSRDGIVFLDRRNQEQWIQSCQIQNPVIDVNEQAFAVADSGGNSILVFTEDGFKGEIETTLPIEKISVSNQGIVSAVLKNDSTPMIITYDAAGTILVEHQVNLNSTGYPIAIDMSADGMILQVSFLSTKGGILKSRVAYYNFGDEGKEQTDNQVSMDEYDNTIIPDVFFMDASTSVAVGDRSFAVYSGSSVPKRETEVSLNQEIRSVFHTDKYIGFVLMTEDKSGYEVQLYNISGKMVMKRELSGEYSHVKMVDEEIIMFDGTRGCIISSTGVLRFKGDWGVQAQEIVPAAGINRYMVVSDDELRVVYLTN